MRQMKEQCPRGECLVNLLTHELIGGRAWGLSSGMSLPPSDAFGWAQVQVLPWLSSGSWAGSARPGGFAQLQRENPKHGSM